jgi:leucyl aminopeptidase
MAPARLVTPPNVDRSEVLQVADAVALTRDLVNTPAGDLGPAELEGGRRLPPAARGRAAGDQRRGTRQGLSADPHGRRRQPAQGPRLIDFNWGPAEAPKVTVVGKGVCFDTGGLDIKSSSNMALMKKDMGGAANALGLAAMIMGAT